jgi:hypothetical protein
MNPSFDVLWQSMQSRPPIHLSRCSRLIDIILHNSQPCQLGNPSVISEPDCRVKMFQRFIGCPLSLKRLDVTTRMFGKLRPQGHAGKAGWDGILGRPMAALLPAEDTGGLWLGSHRGWHDRYEAYICMPLYLTSISRVVDSYRLSGCRKMLGRQAGEVPRFGPVAARLRRGWTIYSVPFCEIDSIWRGQQTCMDFCIHVLCWGSNRTRRQIRAVIPSVVPYSTFLELLPCIHST